MILYQFSNHTSNDWFVETCCVFLYIDLALFKQEAIKSLNHSLPLGICVVKLLNVTQAYTADYHE